jgi:hypothetical protein
MITTTRRHLKSSNPFLVQIVDTRDESIATLNDNTADIKIFADGLGLDGKAGAATALFRGNLPPKVLCYHLGPLSRFAQNELFLKKCMAP